MSRSDCELLIETSANDACHWIILRRKTNLQTIAS